MPADPIEIHVLGHKVRLLQPEKGFRTSLDSVFLGAACLAKEGTRILDLGSGVGGAAFCLLWRVKNTHVTGVEIQSSHVDLANKNIPLNAMEGRAEFICADVVSYNAAAPFDHVICNPPYLEAGTYTPSPSEERAMALGHSPLTPSPPRGEGRGEGAVTSAIDISPSPNPLPVGERALNVKDWIDAAFRNLKSGGSLTMIHRADMSDKIIAGLGKRFGAVEIIPLYPKAGQEAKRVIIRAIKDRKTPARLHAGLILHEDSGAYTAKTDAILRDGAAIE